MSALVWFRRDLRLDDHAALHAALSTHDRVYCVFVFDTDILDPLPRVDRRVEFILRAVEELDAALRSRGGALIVRHGQASTVIPALAADLDVAAVFVNRDYEPTARARDDAVAAQLAGDGRTFHDFKDQVIFERAEILTREGRPYSVFTPYKSAWLARYDAAPTPPFESEALYGHLARPACPTSIPDLDTLGFATTDLAHIRIPTGMSGARALFDDFIQRIDRYAATRDFPALRGPSYLSTHLRFGTISIRRLAAFAYAHGGEGARTWLSELIWREFYQMILWHHPRVAAGASFKPEFDALAWDDDTAALAAWQQGCTGYPLVDAAMRQLLQAGWMHNRLRMIAASFLSKDLGLDWRLGEAWFAKKLLDFDLAANNGGWQWAASTGCDAQPWFRIFNPVTQSEKFDPDGAFIRRYLPELEHVPGKFIHAPWRMSPTEQEAAGCIVGRDYPAPVVDHAAARERTLERYGRIRKSGADPDSPDYP